MRKGSSRKVPTKAPTQTPTKIARPEKVGSLPSGVSGWQCFRWVHCASTRRILGAQCFQNGHYGRISSTLQFTVFQRFRRACFRQARVARAALPPSALFRAFPPCDPNSHMRPLPHLGVSDETPLKLPPEIRAFLFRCSAPCG